MQQPGIQIGVLQDINPIQPFLKKRIIRHFYSVHAATEYPCLDAEWACAKSLIYIPSRKQELAENCANSQHWTELPKFHAGGKVMFRNIFQDFRHPRLPYKPGFVFSNVFPEWPPNGMSQFYCLKWTIWQICYGNAFSMDSMIQFAFIFYHGHDSEIILASIEFNDESSVCRNKWE